MLAEIAILLAFGLLLLVNALGVLLVAFQLPGTWLMLGATAIAAWWRWEQGTFGWWTLAILLALALLGELVEFIAGSAGAKIAGASRKGAILAIVGGIAGAIVGSFLLLIPIVGTLLGAALGAGVGSVVGDRWEGRPWGAAVKGAGGAAAGRLGGAIGKLTVACAMWLWVLLAMMF